MKIIDNNNKRKNDTTNTKPKNNTCKYCKVRQDRRGVAAILGGAILAAILFTSVFIYFFVIMQSENVRGKHEVQALRLDDEKKVESARVSAFSTPSGFLGNQSQFLVLVNNTGPTAMNASYIVVYSNDNPPQMAQTELRTFLTATGNVSAAILNPGESAAFAVNAPVIPPKPINQSKTYRIDLISSRGNIFSSVWVPPSSSGIGNGGILNNALNNTGINIGNGDAAIYAGMNGSKLEFKRLKGGTGISLTNDTTTVTIAETVHGKTLGNAATSIYSGTVGNELQFLSLSAGTGISLSKDVNGNLVVSASGEANDGQNIGCCIGIYAGKVGVHLQFKSLKQGSGVTLADSGQDVTISANNTGPQNAYMQVIQGTGSVVLDFKSFGAIFPGFAARNGVDQTGWLANYSHVRGYPAFGLKDGLNTVIVERMSNFDSSQQDLILTRKTNMVTQPGGTPGNQPPVAYICSVDNTAATFNANAYDETNPARRVTIRYTTPANFLNPTWQALFFCTANQGTNTINWAPTSKFFGDINPIFMITRGNFNNSGLAYGQTIPYQSFTLTPTTFNACLRNADLPHSGGNDCDAATASTKANYLYQGAPGATVYVYVNSPGSNDNPPYTVTWIYHDGTAIKPAQTVLADNNVRFTVPTTDFQGNPIQHNSYYVVRVADTIPPGTTGSITQNVYYMTFFIP